MLSRQPQLIPEKVSVPTAARSPPAVPCESIGRQIDRDASCRVVERDTRVAVTGNGVVAAATFKFVKGASVADVVAGDPEAGGKVAVGEIRSLDRLDRPQRIDTNEASPWTVPAARLTVMPPVTASSELVLYTARSKPLRPSMNQVVATASEEVLVPVAAQQAYR